MFVKGVARRRHLLLLVVVWMVLAAAGCGTGLKEEALRSPMATAEQQEKLSQLNQTADELYKKTTSGALAEAKAVLDRFADQVAAMPFTGLTTIEGVHALTDAVVEAKRTFQSARPDPDRCVKAAAVLKLAADTLTHPNQPMWMQYYKVLSEDTRQFDTAVASGKQDAATAAFGHLKDHYATIRPSVWLSRTPSEAERMDSFLTFFGKYTEAGQFRQEVLQNGLGQWRQSLDDIFRKSGDRTVYMPGIQPDRPVLWTLTVGSLIVAVLLFAAWRMFVSERYGLPRSRNGR